MDREKTIELGNQVYNITPFNINSQLRMLEEFLIAKYNVFKLSSNNRIILLY